MKVDLSKLTAQVAAFAACLAAVLFIPAGTVAWPAGWVFFVLFLAFVIALTLWLVRHDPDLLAERMSGIGHADQSIWDKVFLGVAGAAFLAWFTLMALDAVRLGWSGVPVWFQALGAIFVIASFGLFHRTFRENTYLSPAVRLQRERGQTVVRTGPYGYVRHPMYSAFVLMAAGTPPMLGSWYGLLGSLALVALLALRAVFEERFLARKLPGYQDYMDAVRYRLIPFVW